MLKLTHSNDGKEKWQAQEIEVIESHAQPYYDSDHDVTSLNFFDLTGYGSTKENALADFKRKFSYILEQWKAFDKMLFETNIVENDIAEVVEDKDSPVTTK